MTANSASVESPGVPGTQALEDAIHALAQPLTALLFLLELGALHTGSQARGETLAGARTECLRAVKALDEVRSAAHALGHTGEAL